LRSYELIYIIHPELDEGAFNELNDRIDKWITETSGEVVNTDYWGVRKLAYPIRKQSEGQYIFKLIKLAPNSVSELERNLRFLEPVLRYSIIVVE